MTTSTDDVTTPNSTDLTDIGLLILRIGIGAAMLHAGLRKAFDFSTTAGFMEAGGWQPSTFAAALVTATETLGGIALILGVLTPLAACAVIGAMIDAWAVNVSAAALWSDPFNAPFLIALGAATLLFTGAGSLLRRRAVVRQNGLVGKDCIRIADRGDRGRDLDVDFAQRDQPDPLQRPDQLKPTGG